MLGPRRAQASNWLGLMRFLLAAIRVTCTGSCRVSNKANDTAWVAEEGYFNSALSLADKGEFGNLLIPPSDLLRQLLLGMGSVCLPCLSICLWAPVLARPLLGRCTLMLPERGWVLKRASSWIWMGSCPPSFAQATALCCQGAGDRGWEIRQPAAV